MATKFVLKNTGEFEEMLNRKDLRISKALVDTVIKNLKSRKTKFTALTVVCEDDKEIYDVNVEKNDFINTLQANLPNFEKEEMYEECGRIIEAINFLKKKK